MVRWRIVPVAVGLTLAPAAAFAQGAGNQLFQDIWASYYTTIITASINAANALLVGVAPYLVAAIAIMVVVVGALMILQSLSLRQGTAYVVRAIVLTNLLTAPLYTQFIMTPFLTTIPQQLAAAVGVAPAGAAIAVTFDGIANGIDHMAAAMDIAAGGGITTIPLHVNIFLAAFSAQIMIFGVFVVYMLAAISVALVAPVGAALLVFFLFDSTRIYAERWIGKMITLMVLQLLIFLLMQIIQQQFAVFMGQAEAATVSQDIYAQIATLKDVALAFAFGLFLILILPVLAGVLGGSQISYATASFVGAVGARVGRSGGRR